MHVLDVFMPKDVYVNRMNYNACRTQLNAWNHLTLEFQVDVSSAMLLLETLLKFCVRPKNDLNS